jgi:hypothetical protein
MDQVVESADDLFHRGVFVGSVSVYMEMMFSSIQLRSGWVEKI